MKEPRHILESQQRMAKKDWDELFLLKKQLKTIQTRISELQAKAE